MHAMSLLGSTKELLQRHLDAGKSLRQIARECGEDVEYDWLKRFRTGEINDPSVNRVQVLHDCLKTLESGSPA
jgi:hypothetical protein